MRCIMDSSNGRVKLKTIKLIIAVPLLNKQHLGVRAETGWLGIKMICCFNELALWKSYYSLCHMIDISKILYFFYIWSFLTFCIEIQIQISILPHKVNGPSFILSLDNLNEWICPLRRFTITWSQSLFVIERRVVYHASSLIFSLHFQ